MRKIKIIEIGSGWVSTNRHLPALIKSGLFDVVGVISKNNSHSKELADKYGVKNYGYYDNQYEIDFSIDWVKDCEAVMIGTSPDSHFKLAHDCLTNGKHVLMEKPMTMSVEDSKTLVDLSNKKGLKFAIVHNFQFSSSIEKLKDSIKNKKLGKILGITAFQISTPTRRLPKRHEELPLGLFYDESPHLIYLLDLFSEQLKFINGDIFRSNYGRNTPSLVTANFTDNRKIPITLYSQFESTLSERYLIVHGEKKLGIADIFRNIYFELKNDGTHTPLTMIKTTFDSIKGHLLGHIKSIYEVFTGSYLVGNDKVVKKFYEAIIHNKDLGEIDCKKGLYVNELQHKIIKDSNYINY